MLTQFLHEAGGIETNVATGYHAIEFLLWGQDTNVIRTSAGNRPATDYDRQNCTNGSCQRRAQYLQVVTDTLVQDLGDAHRAWSPDGAARQAFLAKAKDGTALKAIVTGLAKFSYGELAGERVRLGLLLHDQEEEHDCFSDNTPYSHYYNVVGIQNVYLGRYQRPDGSRIQGAGLSDLVADSAHDLDQKMRSDLQQTLATTQTLIDLALDGQPYDYLIDQDNAMGNPFVEAVVEHLGVQTQTLVAIGQALQVGDIDPSIEE